ncbi:SDR family oxidoreductase [Nannocystis punicea]|uniref:SDR family oxidoreductase n=1 Tax=Nannocystis punicea TaxID=2995304 RepID=A0ABY7GVP4_9BACT|nr:SDR family oxidoreductase [Nannocystis poenicansa]WAS90985.1 SDR family oxidoreductase [Nannocystis poenicansa]
MTSNGIMPGLIDTPALDGGFREVAARHGGTDPAEGRAWVLKNAVHQTVARLGTPADIAAAVCFLASPRTDFMTGATFRIDGGATPTL